MISSPTSSGSGRFRREVLAPRDERLREIPLSRSWRVSDLLQRARLASSYLSGRSRAARLQASSLSRKPATRNHRSCRCLVSECLESGERAIDMLDLERFDPSDAVASDEREHRQGPLERSAFCESANEPRGG